jgi:hypothetical protein
MFPEGCRPVGNRSLWFPIQWTRTCHPYDGLL